MQGHSRATNATVKRMKESIAAYERDLQSARAKAQRDVQAEQRPILDRLHEIDEESLKAARDIAKARHSHEDADESRREQVDRLTQLRDDINRTRDAQDELRRGIQSLEGARQEPLANFGQEMPAIVRAIQAERGWQNGVPVGPIGQHVKLSNEYKMYSNTLESFFSKTLNAFLVDNEPDKQRLNRILRNTCKGERPPILKQSFDPTFDFSRGVPPEDILTVHRVLTFSGPHARAVETALINSLHIEKASLVKQRAMGDQLMRNRPYNVESCFSADGFRLTL